VGRAWGTSTEENAMKSTRAAFYLIAYHVGLALAFLSLG
jgi:hypothetical protein